MSYQITVTAKEFSTFSTGKMIYSSQFRKTNGDTKIDKQTRFVSDKYEVMKKRVKVLSIKKIKQGLPKTSKRVGELLKHKK